MVYYVTQDFNYLTTESTFIELKEGDFGWVDPSNPNQVIFGTKGTLPTLTVSSNPAWFKSHNTIPNIYRSEPDEEQIVFFIQNGAIITGPYMPSSFTVSEKERRRTNFITNNIFHDMPSAVYEYSKRIAEKALIETALKYNNGWTPDWNDKNQLKWYPIRKYGVVSSASTTDTEVGTKIYFRSKNYCDKAIEELKNIIHFIF